MLAPLRPRWQPVHGVLLLDKPRGLTSQDALQQARRVLQAAKAGHTGTLDPLAQGLLPLCFGAATKFAQIHLDADKGYDAELQLGVTTSTDDGEGEVLVTRPVPALDAATLEAALAAFRGPIQQVPPHYSALKRDGRPLYELARAGVSVELAPRPVTIHQLQLLGLDGDCLRLRVRCSKGTYIRALARDIGAHLGCGAHLRALERTASGGFGLDQAVPLARLRDMEPADARALLLSPDTLVQHLPALTLDASSTAAMLHGQRLAHLHAVPAAAGSVRLYGSLNGCDSVFLGLGRWDGHVLSPLRLFSTEELSTSSPL